MTLRTLHRQLQQQRRAARTGEMPRPAPQDSARRPPTDRIPSKGMARGLREPLTQGELPLPEGSPHGRPSERLLPAAQLPFATRLPPAAQAPWDEPQGFARGCLAERLEAIRADHPKLYASLARLDEAQLAAVLCESPSVLVRAPVGSGKTHVLVHRVLFLHCVRAVPLRQMAVLTFTNRAAAEIRARILTLRDDQRPLGAEDLWLVGTFHAVARALLSEALPLDRIGYRPDFTVIDDAECERLLEELISRHHLNIRRRRQVRRRLRTPEEAQSSRDDLSRLAVLYASQKRAANVMDFDDLIDCATELLSLRGSAEGSHIASAPSSIVVDELQDCEPRELQFLRMLRGGDASFFAVGDPNQAIYGWRGSAPGVFSDAKAQFACREHMLEVNYRSTRTILEAARSVLGLQAATACNLTGVRDLGTQIVLRRHHDPLSEALYLAERLASLHAEGVPYREMAILFRLRAQGEVLRGSLVERGVPCAEVDDPPAEAVRLLTLHAAKGLEFRCVFLSGINGGLVPLGRRRDRVDDAEERRLLFVGMTRARDSVEISYHARPDQAGAAGEVSPYLGALPAWLVDRYDGSTVCNPHEPTSAKDTLVRQLRPGQAVSHARYGRGVVLEIAAGTVECDFGKRGRRSFPLVLCPLTEEESCPPFDRALA